MPFASFKIPAIGVSLLKASLERIGISSKIYYFNINFAKKIGPKLYNKIAEGEYSGSSLIGELIFADAVNETFSCESKQLHKILYKVFNEHNSESTEKNIDHNVKEITELEQQIIPFIEGCKLEILRQRPKLIGFTSTFHQNCASLALAKAIKAQIDIPIIFGGANCEGEMGATLLKVAPWIDFICSGEGDIAFVEFMKTFLKQKQYEHKINGIITRESNIFETVLTNPVMDMDCLPYPNFDDYFEAYQLIGFKFSPGLVIETSRGCWWGEKFQCTFCGLNGLTMRYRSKSTQRVLNELKYLIKKYNNARFQVVDNIMDLKYIDTLFPISSEFKAELFYETKSNLSKDQLLIMKNAGVVRIQPGIESLSDIVLRIMKKGVTALHNIQTLKWCKEINISVAWNLLYGFPKEPPEEYAHMAEIIPMLTHLQPPSFFSKIILDRFSPYFMEPLQNGLINIHPVIAYDYIYPFGEEYTRKIAYHFDFKYSDDRDPSNYVENLREKIYEWKKIWKEGIPVLNMYHKRNQIIVTDTRPCALQRFHILSKETAKIYETCDAIHSVQSILIAINKQYPLIIEEDVQRILHDMLDKKLMISINDKYLSLATSVLKYS